MKKIIGLAMIILVAGFVIQATAQSKNGAVKASDKSKPVPAQEQVGQEEVAVPNAGSKPAPSEVPNTGSKPVSKPAPSADTAPVAKPAPVSKPAPSTGTITPAPTPKPKAESGTNAPADQVTQPAKGPSRDKRIHAEQRSKGNAFSGKGKGGDKNLIDPVAKDKDKAAKTKKNKKAKKTKKVK